VHKLWNAPQWLCETHLRRLFDFELAVQKAPGLLFQFLEVQES